MMKVLIICLWSLALFGCGGTYGVVPVTGYATQDCITAHLKVVKATETTDHMYETISERCTKIFGGRP